METVLEDLKILAIRNENEARAVIVRAAETGAINSSDILPVFHEYRKPRHVEFEEPTRWALLNAFTETVKKYPPARVDYSYRQLTRCFGLDGKQASLWS